MEHSIQCNNERSQLYERKKFLKNNQDSTKSLIKHFLWSIVLLFGLISFQAAKAEDAKSPTFKCVKCGGPHGGLHGDYCQWCAYKYKTDRASICELERMAGNRVAWCD